MAVAAVSGNISGYSSSDSANCYAQQVALSSYTTIRRSGSISGCICGGNANSCPQW